MSASKAQIRASAKYNRENTVQVCIRLNKIKDADVIEKLALVKSKSRYIKWLIRKDNGG